RLWPPASIIPPSNLALRLLWSKLAGRATPSGRRIVPGRNRHGIECMGHEKTAAGGRFALPAALGALPTGAAKVTVDLLGRRIASDVYLPGEIMPTEAELAESLNVSRATIRDAVKVLSGKGLVRTARRYGTRVRPVEEWNLLDADVVSWHEHSHP